MGCCDSKYEEHYHDGGRNFRSKTKQGSKHLGICTTRGCGGNCSVRGGGQLVTMVDKAALAQERLRRELERQGIQMPRFDEDLLPTQTE